jgi:peptidoglycan/xylan/chitin deacetylase (PgdA/CDA1 family)
MAAIHLTFDDGPGPATRDILALLRAYGVRATFFVVGRNISEPGWCSPDFARDLVIEAIRDGHEIGNHTFSHDLSQTNKHFLEDVERCDALIHDLYARAMQPIRAPIRVRLPRGILLNISVTQHDGLFRSKSAVVDLRVNLLSTIGRAHFHWTSDFDDWEVQKTETLVDKIEQHITAMLAAELNPVLLLHDGSAKDSAVLRDVTVSAVEHLLMTARQRNWSFIAPPA